MDNSGWLDEVHLKYQMNIVELALANARTLGTHPLVIQQIDEILQAQRARFADYHLTYG
jgi:hypothetical protein